MKLRGYLSQLGLIAPFLSVAAGVSLYFLFPDERLSALIFIGVSLVGLLIAIWMMSSQAKMFREAIDKLSERAEQVARGEFEEPIMVEGPQELQELASQLNDMTWKLKQVVKNEIAASKEEQASDPIVMDDADESMTMWLNAYLRNQFDHEQAVRTNLEFLKSEKDQFIMLLNEIIHLNRESKEPMEQLQVEPQVTAVLSQFNHRFKEKELYVSVDVPEWLPPITMGGYALQKILSSLCEFAWSRSPKEGSLHIQALSNRSGWVDISFTFENEGASNSGFEVEPIYLRVARLMIEQFGGSMKLQQTEGVGSCLSFAIPAK
ncbi:HAMP domain-containing protein [Marinicrinis sediminis]|uniref:HAMP domain-containing protein n=1 Tax=Marinicrinis sediminis TaxID=1652465 RepID=A0ABW5RGL0_9BACL